MDIVLSFCSNISQKQISDYLNAIIMKHVTVLFYDIYERMSKSNTLQ